MSKKDRITCGLVSTVTGAVMLFAFYAWHGCLPCLDLFICLCIAVSGWVL